MLNNGGQESQITRSLRDRPLVTVIIATKDRPQMLRKCLNLLLSQDYKPFEIIVVDNSTLISAINQIANDFPAVNFIVTRENHSNPSILRNIGATNAHGEILALIDDDSMVCDGWMEALVEAIILDGVGGVVGRVIEAGSPEVNTDEIGRFTSDGRITTNFNNTIPRYVDVEFMYGCNLAVRRKVLEKVGLYDPWFGITYEETDLSFRIKHAGYRIIYAPQMIIEHVLAPRPVGVVRRSAEFNLSSRFVSCRSLAYMCVSHFGLQRAYARVGFYVLPKTALKEAYLDMSIMKILAVPTVTIAAIVGYLMAAFRWLGLHQLPKMPSKE